MEQINRIRKMERKLNLALKAVRRLEVALNQFEMMQSVINELDEYYGSEEWKADRAADEAGQLPPGLKRGVLSEDAIWNLLADNKDLLHRLNIDLNKNL